MDKFQTICKQRISIHAPREGSDWALSAGFCTGSIFLSTLPARGATSTYLEAPPEWLGISIHAPREGSDRSRLPRPDQHICISIHAPREGSDSRTTCPAVERQNFYPRSPRGERQGGPALGGLESPFLSTLPARGATQGAVAHLAVGSISIHAPREGSDLPICPTCKRRSRIFLSTLPARGAMEVTIK